MQAFLTLPDLTADGGGGLDERCQVIQPFSIETAVEHCVEPTSTGNYRCLLLAICIILLILRYCIVCFDNMMDDAATMLGLA